MKINMLRGAAAVAILASAGFANAQTVTVGSLVNPSTFPDHTLAPNLLSGGSVFVLANNSNQIQGSWNPFGQSPNEDTAHQWVDVPNPGSATLDISGNLKSNLDVVWGSPNPGNAVTFMNGTTIVATVWSSELWPNIIYQAPGTVNLPGPGFLVDISGVGPYTSVVFSQGSSQGGYFEFAVAAPELSTWAMMLAGFAGLGFVGYRRQKSVRAG